MTWSNNCFYLRSLQMRKLTRVKIKNIIKRIVLGVTLIVCFVGSTLFLASYIYKDEIISFFIRETNKRIDTPIEVKSFDISIFSNFPNVTVELKDVTIKESYPAHKGVLGKAHHISAAFSPFDLLNEHFIIQTLIIREATVNLKIDKQGNPNYLFYKKSTTGKKQDLSIYSIISREVAVDYEDQKSDIHVAMVIAGASTGLEQHSGQLNVTSKGNLVTDEISVGQRKFFDNKKVQLKTITEIDVAQKKYNFKTGRLIINQGIFNIKGFVNAQSKEIDLDITGKTPNFKP